MANQLVAASVLDLDADFSDSELLPFAPPPPRPSTQPGNAIAFTIVAQQTLLPFANTWRRRSRIHRPGASKSPTRDPTGRPRSSSGTRKGLGPGSDRSRSNDRRRSYLPGNAQRAACRSYSRSRSTSSSRSTAALFPDAAPQFRYVRRRGVQSTTRSSSYSHNDASQGKTSGDAANHAFGKRRGGGRPTLAA